MSAPVLALSVRDVIQSSVVVNGAALDSNSCEVGFDGSVKPSAGQLYIAVHLGNWSATPSDYDLDEMFGVKLTVNLRLGDTPLDRYGVAVWTKATTGLDAVCRQLIALLHQNQLVRLTANGQTSPVKPYAFTASQYGFSTTTQFTGSEPPQLRDYRWWNAEPPDDVGNAAPCGVSQTLSFGKVQRCQQIIAMT